MRISDWSSDVCSSDLADPRGPRLLAQLVDGAHPARRPHVHHRRRHHACPAHRRRLAAAERQAAADPRRLRPAGRHLQPQAGRRMTETIRAADVLARRLYDAGCRWAFGIPGGEVLTFVDALEKAGIRFVLAKHENAAGFMAEGVHHMTGAPGILVATVGRSEEHTSELQSLMRISYAVLCLKTKKKTITTINQTRRTQIH